MSGHETILPFDHRQDHTRHDHLRHDHVRHDYAQLRPSSPPREAATAAQPDASAAAPQYAAAAAASSAASAGHAPVAEKEVAGPPQTEGVRRLVVKHPLVAILGAVSTGFLVGRLLR